MAEGTLQGRLDAITAKTRRLVQPERLAFSEQAAADLLASGIEERVLPVGAMAPDFALRDGVSGKVVRSTDLLSVGPLVLTFFRGRWDPYCVTELEVWRDFYPEVRRRKALLVSVSPQTGRQSEFMAGQHGLPFPLLADEGAGVATAFGLSHTLSEAERRYYRSILVNIPYANAGVGYERATEANWRLPLPGTFVLGQDGRVIFREAHADPRVRPEPGEVIGWLP